MAGIDDHPERRRYYPDEEDVPLSTAISRAIEAHENASLTRDELDLYQYVNPEAIDMLFADLSDSAVDVSVQFNLTNVSISVWSDGGIDIRVSDKIQ